MSRNNQSHQQFRFNKVNNNNNFNNSTNNFNSNNNSNGNSFNDNMKRKIDTMNSNQITSPSIASTPSPNINNIQTNGENYIKKLRTNEENISVNDQVQMPIQQNNEQITNKSHLQILNDLTVYHRLKVKYDVIDEKGPQHAKIFQIKCTIFEPKSDKIIETYQSEGTSINKAKQSVAEKALAETSLDKPSLDQMKKKRAVNNHQMQQENQRFHSSTKHQNRFSSSYQSIENRTLSETNNNRANNLEANTNNSNNNKTRNNSNNKNHQNNNNNNNNVDDANQELSKEFDYDKYEIENQQFNKRHLLAKHLQIQPDQSQVELIEYLVNSIEINLKNISDKFMNEELKNNPINSILSSSSNTNATSTNTSNSEVKVDATDNTTTPNNNNSENYRELKGVFRVGPIEKGVFIKSDRNIDLIVLTAKLPNYFLVKKIVDELETSDLFKQTETETDSTQTTTTTNTSNNMPKIPACFNKNNLKLDRNQSLIKTEACIYLYYDLKQPEQSNDSAQTEQSSDNTYRFKLSFSSMEINKNIELTNLNANLNSTDDFYLPLDKCLNSLTEMNRIKWFNNRLRPIANAMLILRIMRDLCKRSPTWFILNDWYLEIIIEKCFFRNKFEDLTLKFRTVFESITSGILYLPSMSYSSKCLNQVDDNEIFTILDPINDSTMSEHVDAKSTEFIFDSINMQQREDLTFSAQHALRLLALNKIHQILAIDLILPNTYGSNQNENVDHVNSNLKEPSSSSLSPSSAFKCDSDNNNKQIIDSESNNISNTTNLTNEHNFADD